MNQPKRYACLRQFGMLPAEDGIWVEYEDYAALVAENERLRKAGDAMRDCVDSDIFPNIIAAWNAAKEGAAK